MNNNLKQPHPEYKFDKCEVSRRYFIVGGGRQCRHILTGLHVYSPAVPEELRFPADLHVSGTSFQARLLVIILL